MMKNNSFIIAALLVAQVSFVSSAFACDKHVVADASKKLLEKVPSLATVECARHTLKEMTVGKTATSQNSCYQLSPAEQELAKQIASEEETSKALKNVFAS